MTARKRWARPVLLAAGLMLAGATLRVQGVMTVSSLCRPESTAADRLDSPLLSSEDSLELPGLLVPDAASPQWNGNDPFLEPDASSVAPDSLRRSTPGIAPIAPDTIFDNFDYTRDNPLPGIAPLPLPDPPAAPDACAGLVA
jgi:hypothetical protein